MRDGWYTSTMETSTWWTISESARTLWVIASCHWRRTSLPSVGPVTTSLQPVVHSLSIHATKRLVQAFISFCLDYCNSLLYGINDGLYFATCSRYRMPPHGWSAELVDVTTFHRCSGNCTGLQSVGESRSMPRSSCTSR